MPELKAVARPRTDYSNKDNDGVLQKYNVYGLQNDGNDFVQNKHNICKLTVDMSHGYFLVLPTKAQLVAPPSRTHTSRFFPSPYLFVATLFFSWGCRGLPGHR